MNIILEDRNLDFLLHLNQLEFLILSLGLGILAGLDAIKNPNSYPPKLYSNPTTPPIITDGPDNPTDYGNNKVCYYRCPMNSTYAKNISRNTICPPSADGGHMVFLEIFFAYVEFIGHL